MKKSKKGLHPLGKGLLGASLGFALCSIGWVIWLTDRTLPSPLPITTQIFQELDGDAIDVFPAERVHPGTFKIEIAPFQLLNKATHAHKKVIATYDIGENNDIVFEYWLPKSDGVFYYAQESRPNPFGGFWRIKYLDFDYGTRYLNIYTGWPIALIVVSLLLSLVAGFVIPVIIWGN